METARENEQTSKKMKYSGHFKMSPDFRDAIYHHVTTQKRV